MRRLKAWTLSALMAVQVILVSAQASSSRENLNTIEDGPDSFGLTAYGEPCSDDCKPRDRFYETRFRPKSFWDKFLPLNLGQILIQKQQTNDKFEQNS
jgi:hypothetical protein